LRPGSVIAKLGYICPNPVSMTSVPLVTAKNAFFVSSVGAPMERAQLVNYWIKHGRHSNGSGV